MMTWIKFEIGSKNPVLSNSFIFLVYTKISIVSYTDLRIKNTEKWQNIEHK